MVERLETEDMHNRFYILIVVVLLLLPNSLVHGQFNKMTDEPYSQSGLILDHALFSDESFGKVRLELYYQFYNFVLQWLPKDDVFVGKYEVIVRVRNDKGHQVDSYTRSRDVVVSDEARSRSRSDFRTNQVNFLLDPGKYTVEFILRDRNSSVALSRKLELKFKKFTSKLPRLSDVEFLRTASQSTDDSSVFAKGDLIVVPSVTREFNSLADNNRLLYYLEIYRGSDSTKSVFVETAVRRRWGSLVYRDSITIDLPTLVTRQLREMSMDSLAPGDYELELKLRGRRNKKIDQKKMVFSIAWTQEAMLRHDYSTTLDLMSLIAETREIKELRKLKTYEERLEGLHNFWQRHDPTPGSAENEIKNEFFRRVRLANRSFMFMRQPGWRTDRGRVYVKHGEPDEIDDYPFAPNSHPYQEWHYYDGGRYRKFTFVDENEDGDYRLTFPYDGLNLMPDF